MSEIAKEYSKALFELALESKSEKKYEEALDVLIQVFSENPEYTLFLSSPSIPLDERLRALNNAFSKKIPVEVISFVKLLCEKRYIKHFNECVSEYKNLLNEMNKCLTAEVISAVELNEQEKTALKEKLEKMSSHTVLLECRVDKSILGGLIVELDGKTFDASIKGHLDNIKDVIDK